MRDRKSTKKVLEAGIAIIIATLFILPASAVFITKQTNSMSIGSYDVTPGQTGLEIIVNGEWAQTISGYSIGMQFDPAVVDIVDVSAIGTIAEDAFIFNWNIPSPGLFSMGAAWMMPTDYKPPGTGILLKMTIDILSTAPEGTSILDLGDFGGTPPVSCLYSDSASVAIVPDTLTDGILNVEIPTGEMSIGDYTVYQGDSSVIIPINGTWEVTISGASIGLQFDPTVCTLVDVTNVGTVFEGAFIFNWIESPTGTLSIGGAWMMPADFKPPGSGILAYVEFDILPTAPVGVSILDLDNFGGAPPVECVYSDAASVAIYPDTVDGSFNVLELPPYTCGDLDNDGKINIVDLCYLVQYLYNGGAEPQPFLCVGNYDGLVGAGGLVDMDDLTYIVDYLFRYGPPPVETCCD